VAQFKTLREHIHVSSQPTRIEIDLTPSELSGGGRMPAVVATGSESSAELGSAAHKILELGVQPSPEELERRNLADLSGVFNSTEWRSLQEASPEREMAFMLHLRVAERDCWIRGRMDAVVPGNIPRVVDYKYARWHEGADDEYGVQLVCYSLALMKALNLDRVVGELWFLKPPMKIVRREYVLHEAQSHVCELLERVIDRLHCNGCPPG
jgi:hypothetical protein